MKPISKGFIGKVNRNGVIKIFNSIKLSTNRKLIIVKIVNK